MPRLDSAEAAAVNHPVRMFGVMRFVVLFAVVVALRIYQISAFPRTFPRHEVAADGDDGIAARVVQADVLA